MVERLINEVNIALENRLYLVALNTALTLPDICGRAKYPNTKTSDRYKMWYKEYIGQYEQGGNVTDKMPYLNEEVVYQLRCALLHQGNPNIGKEKTGIDCFELVIEAPQNGFGIYVDSSCISEHPDNTTVYSYRVSIHGLCFKLCSTALAYYKNNKEQFNFFDYTIIDMEKELVKMQPYLKCIEEYEIEETIRKMKEDGKNYRGG